MSVPRPWVRSPLFRGLLPAIVVLTCLPVGATAVVALTLGHRAAAREAARRLSSDALILRESLRAPLAARDGAAVDALAKRLGARLETRFTVIDGTGVVLGDSDHDPGTMDNHRARPEVAAALEDGTGQAHRWSDTLGRDAFYVAVRVDDADPSRGIVRAALAESVLSAQLRDSLRDVALAALPLGLLALASLSIGLIRLVRDLEDVTRVARSVESGRSLEPLRASDRADELGDLARSVHRMARELEGRIQTTARERNELATIVEGMEEGLVATDGKGRLLLSNEAAARVLGLTATPQAGKDLVDVVPHGEVVAAVRDALATRRSIERTVEVFQPVGPPRLVEARVAPVAESEGVIVLLRDVTEAVRYERLRRDFVSNVSHELRTPLSLVKGFLETLEDGALADPEKGPRFLAIASRHVRALEALVEDLLTLGRLDAGAETRPLEPVSLVDVVDGVLAGFEEVVKRKGLSLVREVPDGLPRALGHRDLVERALRNLVDNAVKYTDAGSVRVTVSREGGLLVTEVADTGIGIPRGDLPRIFERFYRVEKSRSRDAGGTGLGLAIVKHVANQEGGSIAVESEVGKGSRFRLALRVSG